MKKYGEPAGTRTGKRQVKRRSLGGRTAENTAKPARPAKYAPGRAVRRVGDRIRELGGKRRPEGIPRSHCKPERRSGLIAAMTRQKTEG